jgi:DNA-binding NarL/FixJ family response regulator
LSEATGSGEERSPARIRVALADDQSLVLEGLKMLLSGMDVIEVRIAAASGAELLDRMRHDTVDVAIVDVRMPGMSGLEVTKRLSAAQPPVPVILLTTFDEPQLLPDAVRCGASGLLLKGVSPDELVAAIRSVAAGGRVLLPVDANVVREARELAATRVGAALSDRERDVLRLVAAGRSNKEIARALGIVEGTVKNYMSQLLIKLDARDRTQAVMKAIGAGLLS